MLKENQIQRDLVLKYLSAGVCKVYFQKVTNGKYRSLYCSLNYGMLNRNMRKSLQEIFSPFQKDIDLIPVYDIIDKEWKSFRLSSVIYFYTTQDLMQSKTESLKIKELL